MQSSLGRVGRGLLEEAIDLDVLESVPFFDVLAESAFARHAEFREDAAGSRIAREMTCVNSIEAQLLEAKGEKGSGRLGAETLIPKGSADPVAKLRSIVFEGDLQANGADQSAGRLACDGKHNLFAPFKPVAMVGNPFFGHAVFIRVRDVQRRVGHSAIAGEPLKILGVGLPEGAKQES